MQVLRREVVRSHSSRRLVQLFLCVAAVGFLLAIFEKAGVISPLYSDEGNAITRVGTVAAGYQNFIICIEMFFAAIALRFAFPVSTYGGGSGICGTGTGRTVSLQSISSNLKETMNPKDIMADAIHNFHPNYQQYTQHSAAGGGHTDDMEYYNDVDRQPTSRSTAPPVPPRPGSLTTQSHHEPPSEGVGSRTQGHRGQGRGAEWDTSAGVPPSSQPPSTRASHYGRVGGGGYTEKTTLLSSDEELQ